MEAIVIPTVCKIHRCISLGEWASAVNVVDQVISKIKWFKMTTLVDFFEVEEMQFYTAAFCWIKSKCSKSYVSSIKSYLNMIVLYAFYGSDHVIDYVISKHPLYKQDLMQYPYNRVAFSVLLQLMSISASEPAIKRRFRRMPSRLANSTR